MASSCRAIAASLVSRLAEPRTFPTKPAQKTGTPAHDPYVCNQKLENDRPKGRWTRSLERSEPVASHEVGHLGEIEGKSEALRDRCGD